MDYKDVSDYELLYLIEDEDEKYTDILFEKYLPIIYNICKKYYLFFSNKRADYDDFIQEGLIAFYDAIRGFSLQKNAVFYSYVVVCVENRLKDYLRKRSRNKSSILDQAISLDCKVSDNIILEDLIFAREDTFQSILLDESVNYLIKFKNSLTFKEAQVFELRMNGFSYREISLLLEIKTNNIYSYIRQIKRKMVKSHIIDCVF